MAIAINLRGDINRNPCFERGEALNGACVGRCKALGGLDADPGCLGFMDLNIGHSGLLGDGDLGRFDLDACMVDIADYPGDQGNDGQHFKQALSERAADERGQDEHGLKPHLVERPAVESAEA